MPDKHQHPFCFGNIEGSTVLLVTKVESVSCSVHYLNGKGHLLKLADDLQTYLRLMLLYLGLPDWPLLHLKIEPSYWVKVSHPSTRNNSAALIVWRLPPESCTHLPARGQGRRRQWSNSASDLRMTYMRGRSVRFPPIMIGINIEINRRIQWRCLVAQGQPRNKNKRNQTSVIPSFSVRSEVFFFPHWWMSHQSLIVSLNIEQQIYHHFAPHLMEPAPPAVIWRNPEITIDCDVFKNSAKNNKIQR